MESCTICNHSERIDIESALLAGQSIASIADYYEIPRSTLKRHRDNCAQYVLSLEEFDKLVAAELEYSGDSAYTAVLKPGSLQRQLNIREGDILAGVAQEYMTTLKNLGRMINKFIKNSDSPDGLSAQQRFLRLPTCQLYVQIGGEIRQTVKTMADIEKQLHAPEPESPLTGLQALASAITRSHSELEETPNRT